MRDGELGEEAARAQTERDAERARSAVSLVAGNPVETDSNRRRVRLNPRAIVAEGVGHQLVEERTQQAERIRDANQLLNK